MKPLGDPAEVATPVFAPGLMGIAEAHRTAGVKPGLFRAEEVPAMPPLIIAMPTGAGKAMVINGAALYP
ncbi:hypothetical protein AB0M44_20390 [Streptosporangium subroseum]|uniref:hypothetical protein n=1 Tax=Streptosporangium subroseum TaxID=106412 RepID=UPI003442806A